MGKFTLNPKWLPAKTFEWETRIEELTERIYAASQARVPVSNPNRLRAGPFLPGNDRQLRKLQSRRQRRSQHKPGTLKKSGRVMEVDNLSGGVIYTAPYAIFPEVGTSRQPAQNYLLHSLTDFREEIESGAFLKEK